MTDLAGFPLMRASRHRCGRRSSTARSGTRLHCSSRSRRARAGAGEADQQANGSEVIRGDGRVDERSDKRARQPRIPGARQGRFGTCGGFSLVHRRNIYGIVIWCFLFDQCPDMRECYRVLRRSAGQRVRERAARRGGGIRIPVWFASRDCQDGRASQAGAAVLFALPAARARACLTCVRSGQAASGDNWPRRTGVGHCRSAGDKARWKFVD